MGHIHRRYPTPASQESPSLHLPCVRHESSRRNTPWGQVQCPKSARCITTCSTSGLAPRKSMVLHGATTSAQQEPIWRRIERCGVHAEQNLRGETLGSGRNRSSGHECVLETMLRERYAAEISRLLHIAGPGRKLRLSGIIPYC